MSTLPSNLQRRQVLALVAAAVAAPSSVLAQAYPVKPIRLVVPLPAGSAPDVIARFWGERMAPILGQGIVIDNRPGAATIIAAQAVATAAPDGYTLLFAVANTTSINPYIYQKLPYKADDFVPVVRLATGPYVLVVSNTSPYKTVADVVKAAKEAPNQLTYASYGIGTITHVVFARFGNVAGVSMTHVPYKDGGITDIIGARVTGSFEPTATAIPMVQSGRLRAIAVTSAKRLDSLPDVPTVAETYPGFVAEGWLGLLAPRQTPAAILAKLAEESNKVIASPDFRARTLELGLRPVGGTPADFQKFLAEDAGVWSKVTQANDIRAD